MKCICQRAKHLLLLLIKTMYAKSYFHHFWTAGNTASNGARRPVSCWMRAPAHKMKKTN